MHDSTYYIATITKNNYSETFYIEAKHAEY
jgi:hypothetical protein